MVSHSGWHMEQEDLSPARHRALSTDPPKAPVQRGTAVWPTS